MEETVLKELVEKNFTIQKISEYLDVGNSTVKKYLKLYGLVVTGHHKKHLCGQCGETNPVNFYKRRKIQCKKCFNLMCLRNQIEKKLKAIEYMGGECKHCGYDRFYGALEFHHIDPNEKDPKLSRSWTFEHWKLELDKCIMLCSNCHREEHHKLRL